MREYNDAHGYYFDEHISVKPLSASEQSKPIVIIGVDSHIAKATAVGDFLRIALGIEVMGWSTTPCRLAQGPVSRAAPPLRGQTCAISALRIAVKSVRYGDLSEYNFNTGVLGMQNDQQTAAE